MPDGWRIRGDRASAQSPVTAPPPTGAPFDPAKVPAGLAGPADVDDAAGSSEHDGAARHQGAPARPSGNESAPNHANYDEAHGQSRSRICRSPDAEERQEGHDRGRCGGSSAVRRSSRTSSAKSSGRVPENVPKVTWTVTRTVDGDRRRQRRRSAEQLSGHVDNSACPAIDVDIQMTLVTPADAKGRCR